MSSSSITCPRCGKTSHHPDDWQQGYCAHCHWWTSDPDLSKWNDSLPEDQGPEQY